MCGQGSLLLSSGLLGIKDVKTELGPWLWQLMWRNSVTKFSLEETNMQIKEWLLIHEKQICK